MATRRERVVLELEDQFTTGMARAAASAALLNKELNSLSRDSVRTQRSFSDIDSSTASLGRNSGNSAREVDKLSGRMRILADVAAVLGPSLVPIGGVGVAAISGLASEFGFASVAAGTAVLAFQGIGDTLKVLNKAALEPTEANLAAARSAMEHLAPAAQSFVREIRGLLPELHRLQEAAANGLLPGAGEGLKELEAALPRIESIISAVSTELGFIARNTGAALASDRWKPFLEFIAAEAPRALGDLSHIVGNTGHALAELWIAFTPLNNGFSDFLVTSTRELDAWATNLSKTQGFTDFVSYIQETGPQVAATFGAIAKATIQIVEAAAPLGGPVLRGVQAFADAVSAIADSDLGTPILTAVAALSLFNRAAAVTKVVGGTTFGGMIAGEVKASAGIRTLIADLRALQAESNVSRIAPPGQGFIGPLTRAQTASANLRKSLPALAKTSALLAGVGVAATGAADSIGLTNTTSLALAGSMAGPVGAAVGAVAGGLIDATHASDDLQASIDELNRTVSSGDLTTASAQVEDLQKKFDELGHVDKTFIKATTSDLARNLTTVFGIFGDNTPTVERAGAALIAAQNALAGERAGRHEATIEANWTAALNGIDLTKAGLDRATVSADKLRAALQRAKDVLTGRSAARDFEAAVDNFAARAKARADIQKQIQDAEAKLAADQGKNGTPAQRKADLAEITRLKTELALAQNSIDFGTPQGRSTTSDLDQIASTALDFAKTITSPVLQQKFLDSARNEFITAAREAGYTKKAAQDLATEVGLLNTVKGSPKIDINTVAAQAKLDQFGVFLNEFLRKPHKLTISTELENPGKKGGINSLLTQFYPGSDFSNKNGGLDGDPKTPWAEGGWTGPGTKWQPAGIVHAEEFVVKRGPAAQFRSQLEQMNRMPGYANGGYVQRMPAMGAGTSIDYDRLADAMLMARPLYGDVRITGDPAQFKQQMSEDRALAGLGGRRPGT